MDKLKAPFPWFGGKSLAAPLIWERFGHVTNYVEPFAGSLAVLLGAPRIHRYETVNDLDGFICNFWRAVAVDPDGVAKHADWPVNEDDLTARHIWLVGQRQDLTERLCGDPEFCDAKIAGWWAWGISCWIGSGWCTGEGPWRSEEGKLVRGNTGRGVRRQRVHLGNTGQGVNRKGVHLGDAGVGVNRQRVHLGDAGVGVHQQHNGLVEWMHALRDRLRRVRVACGDWRRVCGPTPTTRLGLTGLLLDPPYSNDERCEGLYSEDDGSIAAECRDWALSVGDDPRLRIALCGYDTEHEMPGWTAVGWKAKGGYGSQGNGRARANASRETIWFSPHCLEPGGQVELF